MQMLFIGRRFEVPDYQRGYAWGPDQWNDLLEDLETLPRNRDHFTGMIVLRASEQPALVDLEGQQYESFDVVDGQQRLTTIMILLDAIARQARGLDDLQALADGIRRSYLSFVDRSGQPVFRVRVNDGSQTFLESVALADTPAPLGPKTNSERRLLAAREHFAAHLDTQQETLGSEHRDWLLALHDKVAHHLKVNLYVVEDAAEVGVIFEVMNNRGKPLSELDLVKNYVLYLGTKLDVPEHSLHSDVVQGWGSVFRDLMSADLTETWHEEQLLRAHWLMAYDYQRRNWSGPKSIKSRLNLKVYADQHEELLAELRSYVQKLSWAAVAYCDLYKPTRPGAFASYELDPVARKDIIRASDALVRVNALAGFIPLLISARLAHPSNPELYLDVVNLCEKFAFRVFRLRRYRSHAGQSTLFRLAYQLFHGALSPDALLAQLRATLHYYDPESKFAGAFETAEEFDWYRWPGLKYLLYEYERSIAKDDDIWITWAELEGAGREKSIEHVLPQTPEDEYWLSRFTEDDRALLTHDLGNLSLTKDNSSYGRKPFPDKKGGPGQFKPPCFSTGHYRMERELAQYDDWTPESIRLRRATLATWALERWGVPEAAEADGMAAIDLDEEEADEMTLIEI